jgi:hypothetical protein
LQTKVICTKWGENRADSMHFTHPILNRVERGSNVRISPYTYRWNQTGLSIEYLSNFTTTVKRKSNPPIRPNSMCFYDQSRCDGNVPPFSAIILQTKGIRTKWCENSAYSMHFTHPILNRLERGSNVRILPDTNRWNQTRFMKRISVGLHFFGYTKFIASNST